MLQKTTTQEWEVREKKTFTALNEWLCGDYGFVQVELIMMGFVL